MDQIANPYNDRLCHIHIKLHEPQACLIRGATTMSGVAAYVCAAVHCY